MRFIITGGAGFIGSNLIQYLLDIDAGKILNLDKVCNPGSLYTINRFDNNPNYSFIKQDLYDSSASLTTIINNFEPDSILHLAAESHVDRSIDNPETFINSNIKGTFNLLESFRDYYLSCNQAKRNQLRFLHVSTDEVFGSLDATDKASAEKDSYKPNSPYSASKAASDHLVRAWGRTYNLPVIITNCSNNFGPYQLPEKLIPLIIKRALSDEELPVYGDGSNIRDWLYVKDHILALCCVLEKGEPSETYNIGGNCQISNLDLVTKICEILDELIPNKKSYKSQIQFVTDRPGHDHRYAIDISKIKSHLGWQPKYDFNEALRKTVIWYIENQEWCNHVCQNTDLGQRLGLG